VDDEETILELLSGSLRLAGFEVMTAASGMQALRAAAASKPDLGLRLSAAQLRDEGSPFTVPAAGTSAHSWRVLVKPLSGGRRAIIAFSLDDLDNTVTRLEIADALAGAIAVLAAIGLPLVRPAWRRRGVRGRCRRLRRGLLRCHEPSLAAVPSVRSDASHTLGSGRPCAGPSGPDGRGDVGQVVLL